MIQSQAQIVSSLLAFGEQLGPIETFPALFPAATRLILDDPYAFCLGTCLDRGMQAEIVWTMPYWMRRALGHLDPRRVHRMSREELHVLVQGWPKRPRYHNAAPRTIAEITAIVVNEHDGDAAGIWRGKGAAQVRATFHSVHGVGSGIASMAVLLLERGYGIRFADLDRRTMDIKPDVHTRRVLYRLGVASGTDEVDALIAARTLHPEYPGALDFSLWNVGRRWCRAEDPACDACYLTGVCARRI